MQARLAALQPPVLADRRLGERAARLDRQQCERAQRLRLGRHGRVAPLLWNHPLGQVVRALEVLPACDRQLAAIPQRLEHHLGRLPVPHARRDPVLRSPASRAGLRRGSARAPARRGRCARAVRGRACPSDRRRPSRARKCGHSSIGSRHASWAQYSKIRPSRSRLSTASRGTTPIRADSVRRCARSTVEIESSCTADRRRTAASTSGRVARLNRDANPCRATTSRRTAAMLAILR